MRYSRLRFVVGAAFLTLAGCSGAPVTLTPTGGSPHTQPSVAPSPSPTPTATSTAGSGSAPAVLVAGSQRTFTGTVSTTHVYAVPSSSQSNFTSAATFASTTTVENAPSGSPAAFDFHQAYTFTPTQVATAGTQTLTESIDTYENQSMSGSSTTVSETAYKENVTANDATADQSGGGPYTLTTNDAATYTGAPFVVGVFPLQAGFTMVEPLARTIAETQTDQNAGGASTPGNFTSAENVVLNNDGSFSIARTYAQGQKRNIVENANGSAHEADTTSSFADTIAVPVASGGSYTIPVTVTNTSGSTASYSPPDWYPGNALPASPLELETVVVAGPVSSLPSQCAGAIAQPNVVEIDTTHTTLDVFESNQTQTERNFDSNGITDCLLRTTTTLTYGFSTGTLEETDTETYAQVLTSVTQSANARAAAAPGVVRRR